MILIINWLIAQPEHFDCTSLCGERTRTRTRTHTHTHTHTHTQGHTQGHRDRLYAACVCDLQAAVLRGGVAAAAVLGLQLLHDVAQLLQRLERLLGVLDGEL